MNKYFYESEARRIAELNEIFGDIELTEAEMRTLIWLAGWDEYTIENVLSAIRKAIAAKVTKEGLCPDTSRTTNVWGRFLYYTPYPALTTQTGRKDID